MLFRQLLDPQSWTYTYLLADASSREAVLIDPVLEQSARDTRLLRELELSLVFTLETHVHADHVTASGLLRTQLGSQSVMSEKAGVGCADVLAKHGDEIRFGSESLEVRATPGHTSCSLTFVHHHSRRAFTGDALLIRGCGRTDFQEGEPAQLYRSVKSQIFVLEDDYSVFPGHDYQGRTVSTVGEEKRFNPRLGGERTEPEFIEIMNNLDLPRPKLLDVAVPANQKCGFERLGPEAASGAPQASDWAPVVRTPGGVPEVSVEWVRVNRSAIRVVDVREPDEAVGELGAIENSDLVPLGNLSQQVEAWAREEPLVVVCRSGGRSGKAARQLEELGFHRVASMAGGMVRWRAIDGRAARRDF